MQFNNNDLDKLKELVSSSWWMLFLNILKNEKLKKSDEIIKFLASWKIKEAQEQSLKLEYIDYLVSKPFNILKKNKLSNIKNESLLDINIDSLS